MRRRAVAESEIPLFHRRFMTIVREHAAAAGLQQEREDASLAATDVRAVALDLGLVRAHSCDADRPDRAHAQLGFEAVAIDRIERDLRETTRIQLVPVRGTCAARRRGGGIYVQSAIPPVGSLWFHS